MGGDSSSVAVDDGARVLRRVLDGARFGGAVAGRGGCADARDRAPDRARAAAEDVRARQAAGARRRGTTDGGRVRRELAGLEAREQRVQGQQQAAQLFAQRQQERGEQTVLPGLVREGGGQLDHEGVERG